MRCSPLKIFNYGYHREHATTITADTAFRLARYFGTSPDFWINLQARYRFGRS